MTSPTSSDDDRPLNGRTGLTPPPLPSRPSASELYEQNQLLRRQLETLEARLASVNNLERRASTTSAEHLTASTRSSCRRASSLVMTITNTSQGLVDPLETALACLNFGVADIYYDTRFAWYAYSLSQLYAKVIPHAQCSGFGTLKGTKFRTALRRFTVSLEQQGLPDQLVVALTLMSLCDSAAAAGRAISAQDAIRRYLLTNSDGVAELLHSVKDKPITALAYDGTEYDLSASPGVSRLTLASDSWADLLECVLHNINHMEGTDISIDECRRDWEECRQQEQERVSDFLHREEASWRALCEARSFHSLTNLTDYDRLCGIMSRVKPIIRDKLTLWMRKHEVSTSQVQFSEVREKMLKIEKQQESRYPWEQSAQVPTLSPVDKDNADTVAEPSESSPRRSRRSRSSRRRGQKSKASNAEDNRATSAPATRPDGYSRADDDHHTSEDLRSCPYCKRSTRTHAPEACWFKPGGNGPPISKDLFKGRADGSVGSGSRGNPLPAPPVTQGSATSPTTPGVTVGDTPVDSTTSKDKRVTRTTTGKLPPPVQRFGQQADEQPQTFMVSPPGDPLPLQGDSQDNSTDAEVVKKFIHFSAWVPGHGSVRVLVDNASSLSLITKTTLLRCGGTLVSCPAQACTEITAFGGSSVKVLGSAVLTVCFGSRKVRWRLFVVPDVTQLPVDYILLGLNTMSGMDTVINVPPHPQRPSLLFRAINVQVTAVYEVVNLKGSREPNDSPTVDHSQSTATFLSWIESASVEDIGNKVKANLRHFKWRPAEVNFLREDPIIHQKPFRLRDDKIDALEEKLSAMVTAGVLHEVPYSPTDHISNCFVIKKTSGKFRLVTDLQRVNNRVQELDLGYNNDYVEDVHGCLQRLKSQDSETGEIFYALLDAKDAFHNIPLVAPSRRYFTIQFIDHNGDIHYYQYHYLPQGFCHSSQHWLYNVALLLRTVTGLQDPASVGIVWYMDDILIQATSHIMCTKIMKFVQLALQTVGIDTNDKLTQPSLSLEAFGLYFSGSRWRVNDASLEKLAEATASPPTNVADLRSKLGVMNYCRNGYRSATASGSLSSLAAPFHALITPEATKKTRIRWTDELLEQWNVLTKAHGEQWLTLHAHGDILPSGYIWCVATDASAVAAAASIWKVPYTDGEKVNSAALLASGQCVGLISHKFTETQSRWPAFDREGFGIWLGLTKWRPLILSTRGYGKSNSDIHFMVFNDNTTAISKWQNYCSDLLPDTTRGRRWVNWHAGLSDVLCVPHCFLHLRGKDNSLSDLFSRVVDGLYHQPDGTAYAFMISPAGHPVSSSADASTTSNYKFPWQQEPLVKNLLPEVAQLQAADSVTTYQGITLRLLLQAGLHQNEGNTLDSYKTDSAQTTITVRNWLLSGAFVVHNGVLYRKYIDDILLVVAPIGGDFRHVVSNAVKDTCRGPLSFRTLVCHLAHGDSHLGASSIKDEIKRYCWWPNMHKFTKDFIHQCHSCRHGRNKNRGPSAQPLSTCRIPENRSLLHIAVDFADPPTEADGKSIYLPDGSHVCAILVVCDLFTGLVQYYAAPSKSAEAAAYLIFTRWVPFAGLPASVVSDNSPFGSRLWSLLCSLAGVKAALIDTYSPQSNGSCERRVQACKVAISHNPTLRWDLALPLASTAVNSIPDPHTGLSAFQLVYGRKCHRPIDMVLYTAVNEASETPEDDNDLEDETRAVAWFRHLGIKLMEDCSRFYHSLIERRLSESDRSNAGPTSIHLFAPGDLVQWTEAGVGPSEGYVVRDVGYPDPQTGTTDINYSGRYSYGNSYIVRLTSGEDSLLQSQLQLGDFCVATIDTLPGDEFMVGKVITVARAATSPTVHIYDRPSGEKRFFPLWLTPGSPHIIIPSASRPRGASAHIKKIIKVLAPPFKLTKTGLLPKLVEATLMNLGLITAVRGDCHVTRPAVQN
ncbi:hypothetical protein FOZ60_012066 [Perkinsus olseni]|uniref:Uncharacterized protein n=1 Tax=Perkinsus olseni TaxID=32597 RepID=A0A7J6NCK6_PEROL|nr:hypothetical protein FOZ60_012066 [Perkinsus olseni]